MPDFSNRNNINVLSHKSSTSRLNQDILSAKISSFEAKDPTNYLVDKTNPDVKSTQITINKNSAFLTAPDVKQTARKSVLQRNSCIKDSVAAVGGNSSMIETLNASISS